MSGSQVGGLTTLEFFRLLDTGDTAGDRVIGEVYVYIYIMYNEFIHRYNNIVMFCNKQLWEIMDSRFWEMLHNIKYYNCH